MSVDLAPAPGGAPFITPGSGLDGALTRLVYRSRATLPLAGRSLAAMLQGARRRNRRVGVTGLLVADGRHYLQWLEGPAAGIATLMRAIGQDPRHDEIRVLVDAPLAARRFCGWDMRLASGGNPHTACPSLHLPVPLAERLLAGDAAAPDLLATLGTPLPRGPAASPLGERLRAVLLPAQGPEDPSAALLQPFLDAIARPDLPVAAIPLPAARDLRRLFTGLLEPAARRLGDLVLADALPEAALTIALGRMQALGRLLGQRQAAPPLRPSGPAVLVAPLPGEEHLLGAVLASEWLWLSGWAHGFAIPATDAALTARLRAERIDLLDLALSPALVRRGHLPGLRRRLAGFRAAAHPGLHIRLSGRLFAENRLAGGLLGADSASGSCAGLDAVLARLLARG